MKRLERIISIIMLTVISLSNVATPAAYAAEVVVHNTAVPGTDLSQFATTPKFSVDAGSVLGASTSILTVGTQSLDLRQDTATSAHKRIPVQMQKLTKKVFRTDEDVTLAVTNPDNEAFTTTVQDASGQTVGVPVTESNNGNTTTVDLAASDSIKPGKYKIIVTDQDGKGSEQDFAWGVLALNTDKTLYHPGETANISMAVLNDQGDMVCDAKLELRITNKELGINDLLSTSFTDKNMIALSPQCQKHDFSLEPDYAAQYKFHGEGTYQFQLTATTQNGSHTISDVIKVTDVIPFDLQRVSATRIYPPNTYPMTFNVTANRDFSGTVTETVPDSFTITPATESARTVSSYNSMQTVYLNSNDPAAQMSQAIAASSSGGLVMPFAGNFPITQGFGAQLTDPTLQAFYTHYGLAGHDGIDFGLPMNTPLHAVDDGNIIWAGPGDYGITVIIQHSWGESYYGHLSMTSVSIGVHVTKGQLLGYSGMSGEATGPHLHFGMKPLHPDITNGYYGKVDPMQFLPIGQGQSIAALGAGSNPVANLVYNTTVLGASDSADTPTPSSSPTTTPEVSPSPQSLPTATPAASQSAAPSVSPTPTTVPTETTTTTETPKVPDNTEISVLQKQILLDEEIANNALTEKVKIITWHVTLKKGESTSLGYAFQAPHVSPQFYLLGPAHFYDKSGKVVFQEQRAWQIASDDVGVEWYQNTSGSRFNGYSWQYRKKVTIDHTKVTGGTPVAYDATGTGPVVSWNHTISGSNPALLVGVAVGATLGAVDTNMSATATYNGTSMTLLASTHSGGSNEGMLFVFGLLNPTSGSHSVQVTVSGGIFDVVTGGSESFDNVTSFATAVSGTTSSGSSVSATTSGSTSGNIVAGFAAAGSSFTSTSAPSTSRFIDNMTNADGAGNAAGATSPSTGSNVTMTWSISPSTDNLAATVVEVKGTSVAYDTTCGTSGCPSATGFTPSGTSLTWNHTVSGSNPALLVAVSVGVGDDTGMSATATYNGVSMTQVGTIVHTGSSPNNNHGFIMVFGLAGPSTGTNQVSVTVTGGTATEITGGSESFDNVNQSTPFGTAATKSSTSDGTSVTTTAVSSTIGNMVAAFAADGSPFSSVAAPATSEFLANFDQNSGAGSTAGATSPSTGSNVSFTWTGSAIDQWATLAVEVQAADTTAALANYPMEVSLSSDSDLSSKAQSNASDILFTDSTGRTLLPYEIESYSSGTLVAWVDISSLSSTTDTIIYMYYGNPAATTTLGSNTIWDSNYKGVWHLGPTVPNNSTLSVNDSTSNANNGTNGSATFASSAKIDGGASFTATHISTSVDAAVDNLEAIAGNTWSTEVWYNTSTTGTIVILGRATNIGASTTFAVYLVSGALDVRLKGTLTTLGSGLNDGAWHSVTVTWDGNTAVAYLDGGAAKGLGVGTAALQSSNVCMGAVASACTTSQFTGTIDEVRVSNSSRASNWIATEYTNENSPGPGGGGFISALGSVETSIYAPTLSELMGHGEWFDSTGTRQPFVF